MDLGDSFPDSFKNSFANRALQLGSVVSIYLTSTKPPKEKRCIIVSLNKAKDRVAVILINTDLPKFISQSPRLNPFFSKIIKIEFSDILDYDSYVDCLSVHELKYSKLKELLKETPAALLGKINEEKLNEFRSLIKASPRMSKAEKKRFGLA